jgi:hypothetical protein
MLFHTDNFCKEEVAISFKLVHSIFWSKYITVCLETLLICTKISEESVSLNYVYSRIFSFVC